MSRIPPASLRLTCGTLKTPFSGSSTTFFSSQLKQNLSLHAALKICAKSLPWTLKMGPWRIFKAQQNLLPIITHLRCGRNLNFQMGLSQVFFVYKLCTLFGPIFAPVGEKKSTPFQKLVPNMGELESEFNSSQVEKSFKTKVNQKSQALFLNRGAEQALHTRFKAPKAVVRSLKPALSRDDQYSFEFDSWVEENYVYFFLFCSYLIFAKEKAKNNLMVHKFIKNKFKQDSTNLEPKLESTYQMTNQLEIIRFKNELVFAKRRRFNLVYETLKPGQVQVENHVPFKFALSRSFNKPSFLNLFSSLPYALEPCLSQRLKFEKSFKRGLGQAWKTKKPCFVFFHFQKSLLSQKLNSERFHTCFIFDFCTDQNSPYDCVSSIRF